MLGGRPSPSEADRARLAEPALYFADHADELLILDEIHRAPACSRCCEGELAPFDITELGEDRLDRLWVRGAGARTSFAPTSSATFPCLARASRPRHCLAPKLERGFHSALDDLEPERSFVVYPGGERYRLGPSTEAISLAELCTEAKARAE
jgi:hypothetical protein